MSAETIIESLKAGYSMVLSKEEYENVKDYIKKANLPSKEYVEEDENMKTEQIWFTYNRKQYILYHAIYIFKKCNEKTETYSIYRLF